MSRLAALAAMLLLVGATGCEGDPAIERVDFSLLTTPPLPVTISSTEIVIPVGIAVGIEATAYDTEGDDKEAGLSPTNTQALGFIRATVDSSVDTFMYGREVGEGQLSVSATDMEGRLYVPYQVVDQQSSIACG